MTAPSGWSGATTTYTKSITDASSTSNEAFNFGGEFTTSDAAGCPFDGLFHASDGTTVPPVNPSIFTATTSTYVSGTTTYDSTYTLTPGVHTFFLMALKQTETLFSSQMTFTISCDASLIQDPTGHATQQYGTHDAGGGNIYQEFTLAKYTSLNTACGISSYAVSSSSSSVVAFAKPLQVIDTGTDLKIRRTTFDTWFSYDFYIFVYTDGGA